MASQFSTYSKIQAVIDIAKAVSVDSIGALQKEVASQAPPNFLVRKYDRERDTFRPAISERAVRKAVRLCLLLGLIDEHGSLSKGGRDALRSSKFDDVVAASVRAYLRSNGVEFAKLNTMIVEQLHRTPPNLTTSEALWNLSKPSLAYPVFATLLSLLSQCGRADSSQSKIYLKFSH